MEIKKLNNLSKRQQITASSKMVFLWVAGASILAAFSLVGILFLYKQAAFNDNVIGQKQTTEDNLKSNVQTFDSLQKNINLLASNTALSSIRTGLDSSNIQVIFDALPVSYDSANFGASLQNVLLNGTVASIEKLSVASPNDAYASSATNSSTTSGNAQAMPFDLTITGSADQIRTALANMESSIRPIRITALTIDGGTPLTARISGETYYDPTVDLKLTDKVVKP